MLRVKQVTREFGARIFDNLFKLPYCLFANAQLAKVSRGSPTLHVSMMLPFVPSGRQTAVSLPAATGPAAPQRFSRLVAQSTA
jgi:hypothetical protein